MQIVIDTKMDSRTEAIAAIRCIAGLYNLNDSSIEGIISHADRPDVGAVTSPSVSPLTKALADRGMPAPPSLEIAPPPAADPATVFGGAAAQIPPAVPSAAEAPPPPAPPTASLAPPAPPASSPPTAAAPPAPGAAPAALAVLDSKGLPWDVRIHAANHAKNQDGSWRAKRGINDAALVARVEAELRAVQALPAAAAPAAPPPPDPYLAGITAAQGEQPPAAPPAAAVFGTAPPQAAIVFGTAPPPATTGAPQTFPEFMTALTPAMSQNRVTQALITEACASVGVPALPLLAARADLIPAVFEFIRARVQL